MRPYELMVIFSDALDEDAVNALIDRVEAYTRDHDGEVTRTDYWGRRPFAYEIDHRTHGYYCVFEVQLTPAALAELERQLKINDGVVRFKTLRPDFRTSKSRQPAEAAEPA